MIIIFKQVGFQSFFKKQKQAKVGGEGSSILWVLQRENSYLNWAPNGSVLFQMMLVSRSKLACFDIWLDKS